MKLITKQAAAFVLALSIAVPAFAAEEATLLERSTTAFSTGADAMAYAPAYTTSAATNAAMRDLSICSQC